MAKAFLVVRIKGQVDVPHWAKTTLKLLKLEKKFRATIIPAKENTLGMLNKVKHHVAWQEVGPDTANIERIIPLTIGSSLPRAPLSPIKPKNPPSSCRNIDSKN